MRGERDGRWRERRREGKGHMPWLGLGAAAQPGTAMDQFRETRETTVQSLTDELFLKSELATGSLLRPQ